MMRKTVYILIFIVLLLIVILFRINKGVESDNVLNYRYNFSVILDNVESSFETEIINGMMIAAKDLNVSLNFNTPDKSKSSYEISDFLDMSILSKPDGIIIAPDNSKETFRLMEKAYIENLPIITLLNDIKKPDQYGYNGLNSYEVGVQFNKLLNENKKKYETLNVAFIFQNENSSVLNKGEFIEGLKSEELSYETSFLTYPEVEFGSLSAEEITLNVLKKYPEVNTFICLSPNVASGTIRALIDINKIHEISVMNFGYSKEIKKYLDKQLIDYSVIADFEKLGQNAVENLYYLKQHNSYRSLLYLKLEILE